MKLYVGVVGIIAGVLGLPVVDGGRRREAPEGPGRPKEIQPTVDSWGPMAVWLIGVIGIIAGVLGLPVVDGGRRREAPDGPGTPEEIQATVDSWGPIAV